MMTRHVFILCSMLAVCMGACTRSYTVKSGDTCNGIASSQGVSVQTLYTLNPTVNAQCTNLQVGQVLCLAADSSSGNTTASGSVYAIWHCGSDCAWTTAPSSSTFAWILDRGDGKPTTNQVILSFMDPIALVNAQNGNGYTSGVPNGMISSYTYFKSKGIRVIFSIGGAGWSSRFVSALNQDAAQFARNAAACAQKYGVGIEIDVEVDSSSYISQLTTFVNTYRSIIAYDGSTNAAASSLLTMDVGAGTTYLTSLATLGRTLVSQNKLNWLNAMVSDTAWSDITAASNAWQQHLTAGLPANRLIVSHYGSPVCASYSGTILPPTVSWVQTKGVRGISFWAAGTSGGQYVSNCAGIQQGSRTYIP